MYLIYVDESGDPGLVSKGSPTRFFALSALLIPENRWQQFLAQFWGFRRRLASKYGLGLHTEIHASVFARNTTLSSLSHISRYKRVEILKVVIDWLRVQDDIRIITVIADKSSITDDFFTLAWKSLLHQIDRELGRLSAVPGGPDSNALGLIISDATEFSKLRRILHSLREVNPSIDSRLPDPELMKEERITRIVEDPFTRDSMTSYLHQLVDVVSFFARQLVEPNLYLAKRNLNQRYLDLIHLAPPTANENGFFDC